MMPRSALTRVVSRSVRFSADEEIFTNCGHAVLCAAEKGLAMTPATRIKTAARRLLTGGAVLTVAALALAAVGSVYITAVAGVIGGASGAAGLLALCAS